MIDQVVMPLDTRFCCPRCGGFTFGAYFDINDPARCERRRCGDDNCDFTWIREDDWKHFRLSHAFETREGYEAMRRAGQRILVIVPEARDAAHQHAERQVLYWEARFRETL